MPEFADIILSAIMVIAPTVGYVDQYRIILKNKTSLGFNSVTCAILCFANILRLFFWLGKRFDNTLLFQSIAMLTAMLTLLQLVVKYKPHDLPFTPLIRHDSVASSRSSSSSGSSHSSHRRAAIEQRIELKWYQRTFWDWDYFIDYVNCLLLFTSIVGTLYIFLHEHNWFVEALGFLSLGIESTLPLPQLLTNFRQKSVDGFSLLILASWFLGDSFKAFYFVYQNSPIQFVVCAVIQLTFDTIIVFQFIVFSSFFKKLLGIRQHVVLGHEYEPIS
ncbi:PQ loop repeat-domain-containing protein [Parasitella parasitica]|nr:PQ loop repeat-domain-containing protein [Parasitella parasitica]